MNGNNLLQEDFSLSKHLLRFGCVFFVFVSLAWLIVGCAGEKPEGPFTVSEAWEARERLNGKRVTLRGYFGKLEIAQTLMYCDPPRCDCNATSASRIVLQDERTTVSTSEAFPQKKVVLEILECRGDECTLVCSPIDPMNPNEMEVTGILRLMDADKPYAYLLLEVAEMKDIRQRVDGRWQPVPTGSFEVPLRQP
jgi:hypothetical protein